MSPFPGAWFELELGGATVRVKALRSTLATGGGPPGWIWPDLTIACSEGAVRLVSVQREGKGAMDAAAFLRGAGEMPKRAS
jgi:methionyl-tRNA formyltransferase